MLLIDPSSEKYEKFTITYRAPNICIVLPFFFEAYTQ